MTRRRRRSGQGGFTLVEVLVAIVIATLIIGPVSAWAVSTFRHQGVGKDELGRATATGLLNSYYVRDVASARQVAVNNPSAISNCGGIPPGSPPETVVLRLTRSGSAGGWIVYSEVRPTPTSAELWRRVCGPTGDLVDSTVVFDRVVPGTVQTGCPEPGGADCVANRKVSLRLTPAVAAGVGARPPITISAVRRTDPGSVGLATSSPPNPLIVADPARGYRNTQFVLRDASTDPDNDLASRSWTLPAGASLTAGTTSAQQITLVFPSGQTGPVKLTVTDGTGSSVATEISIEILNRNPAAAASCAASGGDPRTMVLSAAGSSDPDGAGGLSFQWTTPDGGSLSGDGVTWVVPAPLAGPQLVTLVVASASGAQSTAFTECPVPAPENPIGGVAISPEPVTGLKPVPRINVPAGGTLDVTFSAEPPVADPAGYALALYRQGAATPTRTSPADTTTWTIPFGGADSGVWEVALVRNGTEGGRREFRINASPRIDSLVEQFQAGDVPARRVAFSSSDSDADGTVTGRVWNFGDGTVEVNPGSTPEHSYTTPGRYTVTLTVTDDDGASTSSSIEVVIPEPTP